MSIIPEIDISGLVLPNSSAADRKRVLDDLLIAFRDIGFVSIVNHGVSQDLIEKMHEAALKFFHSSHENKMSVAPKKWNPENKNVYRGYFPATVHGKEGWDMADPKMTKMLYPDCHLYEMTKYPPDFSDDQKATFSDYYTALHELGIIITKALFEIYGADTAIVDKICERPNTLTTFRLNFYPQSEEGYEASEISAQDGIKLACETHTDSALFTILHQDDVGGLQVQCPSTKAWHDVPCDRKAFVVNTGKTATKLTNGKWQSTFHRVKLGTKERLSIPFFFEPNGNFMVDSKLLFPNEGREHEPTTYREHVLGTNAAFKEYQR